MVDTPDAEAPFVKGRDCFAKARTATIGRVLMRARVADLLDHLVNNPVRNLLLRSTVSWLDCEKR